MITKINPQEAFLLERYISVEYFGELRDVWAEMVSHVEISLDRFMSNLPLDYRNRPLPEQPDAVWGERVLSNFRDTFQSLCEGYIRLAQGDFSGLDFCNGPQNDFKGQQDFWSGWMTEAEQDRYYQLLLRATNMAANISATAEALWEPLELSVEYIPEVRGPLNPPDVWPAYQTNSKISVVSGMVPTISGIYSTDLDDSCMEFLNKLLGPAPEGKVFLGKSKADDPEEIYNIIETRPCNWLLVERVASVAPIAHPSLLAPAHRVAAGSPCPETGYYFTPAKENSRRRFIQQETMPGFDSQYGLVIWQWDGDQS